MSASVWLDAILAGDTAPWQDFRASHPGAVGDRAGTAGAGQLELLRLLARQRPVDPGLAELVLGTPPAGRGPVDLPLPGAGGAAAPAFGTPAVEPDRLPAAELLRVAVPALARLLPRAHDAETARTPLRAPRFVVHGAPGAADTVARALTAAGWVHGPFRATHLVLGCPPDAAMEQLWARRVAAGSVRGWRRTWRVLHARGTLPAPLETAALAERVAASLPARRHGRRLHVVVGTDAAEAAARALAVLGVAAPVDTAPLDTAAVDTAAVDAATVDLRRRLNALPATSRRDTGLLDGLGPAPGVRLGVPGPDRAWAAAEAERLAGALADLRRTADYPVHGDPAALAGLRPEGLPGRVDPADTLARAVVAIGAAWRVSSPTRGASTRTED